MAVSTNLGLYLPTREDYISVSRDLSNNYEIIDKSAGMLEKGIAIVVDGDNAPQAISSGDYLFIKNHSSLATGGYHATANIANGAAVTSSNVAADSDGIVNAAYAALNSNISLRYTDTNSATDGNDFASRIEKSLTRIFTTVNGQGLTVDKTYPVMMVISGSSAGTFCGTFNITSTAIRFDLVYNEFHCSGTFARSNNTLTQYYNFSVTTLDTVTITLESGISDINSHTHGRKNNKTIILSFCIKPTSATSAYARFATASEHPPTKNIFFSLTDEATNKAYPFYINSNGHIVSVCAVPANAVIEGSVSFFI